MKRLFICLLLLVPVMTFAGCSKGNDEPQAETPDTPDNPGDNEDNDDDDGSGTVKPGNGKILIAWFSRWGNTNYASDVDASTGASIIIDKGTHRGTTEVVARYIQTAVGGDLHLIETTAPYPTEFDDVRDQNHAEQAAGTLPSLKNSIENMDQYDVVFIGYPVWATDVPQAVLSFLSVPMTDMEPAAAIVPCRLPHPVRMSLTESQSRLRMYLPQNRGCRAGSNESVSGVKNRKVSRFVLLPADILLPENGSTHRWRMKSGVCFR